MPYNNVVAAVAVNDTTASNATAGCRPSDIAAAGVEHGINRIANDGKSKGVAGKHYKVRRKVSMNNITTVWEVDETNFDSPNKGVCKADGVMNEGGNVVNMVSTDDASDKLPHDEFQNGKNKTQPVGMVHDEQVGVERVHGDSCNIGGAHDNGSVQDNELDQVRCDGGPTDHGSHSNEGTKSFASPFNADGAAKESRGDNIVSAIGEEATY